MWMVDPGIMCRQHLLGEHVELHMIAASINQGRSISGFVSKNLIEPGSLGRRHYAVASEMMRRGYRHNSPLQPLKVPLPHSSAKVDVDLALADLLGRCTKCG